MKKGILSLILASVLWALMTQVAQADWTADRIHGMVTVTNLPGEDGGPKIMRLGSGCYFIDWFHRDTTDDPGKLWYQILDPLGNPLLNSTGNLVLSGATWSYGNTGFHVVSDAQGGAIVIFNDQRTGNHYIYGQRFDQWGQPLWGSVGFPLAELGTQDMGVYDATANPNGEIFFTWIGQDSTSHDLYVQKVSDSGNRPWGPFGVPAGTGPGDQAYSRIVPDTSGGALVLWEDNRAGGYTYYLYAQHFNENGIPQLTPNGTPLHYPGTTTQIVCGGLEGGEPDDQNGGIFVYTTPGASNTLKVIRVNGQGQTQWVWGNGIYAFHGVDDFLKHPVDGTIWISATDNRTGSDQLYLYHLDLAGNPLFNPAGIIGGEMMVPTSGGIITFETFENVVGARIFAKRFNNSGRQIWESVVALARLYGGGAPGLCAISSAPDGYDGAVITMLDIRLYPSEIMNIAAQRVQWNGRLGNPIAPQQTVSTERLEISILSGNQLQFTLAQAGQVKLEVFDLLGRRIATVKEEYQSAGVHTTAINDCNLSSGVYLLRLTTPADQQVVRMTITR